MRMSEYGIDVKNAISKTRLLLPQMTTPASLPVKLLPSNIRPIAYRILSKKHGLNIQTDSLAILTEIISSRFGAEWRGPKAQQFMEDIAKVWKQQDRGLFVDGPGLKLVVKELSKDKLDKLNPTKASRTDTLVDEVRLETSQAVLNWQDFYKFITPDIQPNYVFDRVRKQFSSRPAVGTKLSETRSASIEYFNQRYHLILDRLSRDENFLKSSFSSMAAINTTGSSRSKNATYDITLIKNVLGRDGNKFILFGLLSKNVNGNYILEDSSDYIELNLSQTYKTEGSFYAPGMCVIVEGIYSASGGSMSNDANVISGCFHVSNIGHPPAERRDASLENYGHLDFMGIHSELSSTKSNSALVKVDKALKKKLTALEKALVGHRLVMLGCNCFLDDFKIMAGLKKLFAKLEDKLAEQQTRPDEEQEKRLAIIMTGSFVSRPLTATTGSLSLISGSENYKNNFDTFAELLSKFPLVVSQCKFVLIPGPNDPWQSTNSLGRSSLDTLPQNPVPKVFVTRLERLLPKGNLIFGWNPMRINYISQEIVLFRDDLMSKLKRNDIVFAHDLEIERANLKKENLGQELQIENINTDELHLSAKVKQARQLVKTVLDQGTLQPFLKDLRVINPCYQHAIRIEPLPTTIVLFDSKYESFEVTYNGCKVANIGNLISNHNSRKLNYSEYIPSSKKYAFKELYF